MEELPDDPDGVVAPEPEPASGEVPVLVPPPEPLVPDPLPDPLVPVPVEDPVPEPLPDPFGSVPVEVPLPDPLGLVPVEGSVPELPVPVPDGDPVEPVVEPSVVPVVPEDGGVDPPLSVAFSPGPGSVSVLPFVFEPALAAGVVDELGGGVGWGCLCRAAARATWEASLASA